MFIIWKQKVYRITKKKATQHTRDDITIVVLFFLLIKSSLYFIFIELHMCLEYVIYDYEREIFHI